MSKMRELMAIGVRGRGRIVFAAVLLLFAVTGRSTWPADAQKPDLPAGLPVSVSGTVVDPQGKPIASAKVYLREWSLLRYNTNLYDDKPRDILAETRSDARGRFAFKEVGSYAFPRDWPYRNPWDVIASADGYGLGGLHLPNRETTDPVQIELAPESSISGRIVDELGEPLAGVAISVDEIARLGSELFLGFEDRNVLQLGFSQLAPTVRSDAEGRFRIGGLPGDRRLSLRFDRPEFVVQYLRAATTDVPQPDIVDPRAQGAPSRIHTGPIDVALQRGWMVRGRVLLGDSGASQGGAKVTLTAGNRAHYATTDVDGRFSIAAPREAGHRLTVQPPDAGDYLGRSQPVEFDDTKPGVDIDVRLEKGVVISGSVVAADSGEGIAGLQVSVLGAGPVGQQFGMPATTDNMGRFRLAVTPDTRKIRVTGSVPGYYLPSANPRAAPADQSPFVRDVEIVAGQQPADVRFTIGHGLLLTGRVTDPVGAPVPGAQVSIIPRLGARPDSPSTSTDSEGRYRLGGLPPDSAEKIELTIVDSRQRLMGRVEVPGREQGTERVETFDVQLQRAGRVTGTVSDGARPLRGIRVLLYEGYRQNVAGGFTSRPTGEAALTDAEGRYTFELAPPGRDLNTSIYEDGYEPTLRINRFQVEPGGVYEHPPIVIRKLNASVAGTVVDPDGNPVEGVNISARDRKTGSPVALPRSGPTLTGKDGRFVLKDVPETSLSLMAYLRGDESVIRFPAYADAEPGQTDVRIVLDPKLTRPTVRQIVPKVSR